MKKDLYRTTVHDVDECLTNSVQQHQIMTPRLAQERGLNWSQKSQDMTYDELCTAGGTHKAFGNEPGYLDLNEFLRNDLDFNLNQELIEGALPALDLLRILGYFDFYLTTRPASLAQPTIEWLVNAGFPEGELIARPDSVPIEKTSEWKLAVLEARAKSQGRPKLMIDDSLSMLRTIRARKNSQVEGILHKGPITPQGNGEMKWSEITDILTQVTTWELLLKELSLKDR